MKNIFPPGSKKVFIKTVSDDEIAKFETGTVHELYSTFSIARDAEWATRLFVLEMRDDDEEGIGSFVNVEHLAPALPGSEVIFTAIVEEVRRNELVCSFEARHNDRLLARGRTGQKILKKSRLENLLSELKLL